MMNIPALHIRLFGLLELALDKRPLPAPRASKTRLLLAYLIVHRDRPFARNVLAGAFWPDRPDDLARHALSNALWQIRQALGPAADRLTTEPDPDSIVFTLSPSDWLDVAAFDKVRRCVNPCLSAPPCCLDELGEAVALYRGDLLEECYDDWALIERERLRELYTRALERLLHLHKQRGAHSQALTYAQRLAVVDPLREAAHQELMRLYHLLDRPRAALQQYATLRHLLAEELGVEPIAATSALHHEIVAASASSGPVHLPTASPPPALRDLTRLPLIGRDEERARLLTAIQSAAQGHGSVALVEGRAGVGKTRLIEEIAAGAQWRGMTVGLGRATPDTVVAYHPLSEALSSLLTPLRISQLVALLESHWLSALLPLLPAIADHAPDLPALPPLQSDRARERLWEGLTRCLDALATSAPLLLILEDLHWANDATLSVLPHLALRVRTSRLLILLTCRTIEAREQPAVWEALDALDRALPIQRLSLSALNVEQTADLIGRALRLSQEQVRPLAQQWWAETQGNALFLIESLKAHLEQGNSDWLTASATASVQTVIRERLARLAPTPRQTLEMAAVLGQGTDFALLARAGDQKTPVLIEQLRTLCQRGFLAESEAGYRFTHNHVRETVYRATLRRQRQALHRRAGVALEALHPDRVAEMAHHFDCGEVRDKALTYTLQAGGQAQALYDSRSALAHYKRALALSGDDPAARWDVLARQEEILGVLSRREAQAEVLDEMLSLAQALDDPVRQAHTYHRQGWREVLAGKTAQALSLLNKATALARTAGEQELLGNCLMSAARAWWLIGDIARCRAAIEKARFFFKETGSRRGKLRALNMLGNLHLALSGNYAQALAYFEENRRLACELADPYTQASAQGNIGITCAALGCYQRSQETLVQAFQVMRRVGDRNWQGIIRHWQGVNQRALGDLSQAQARAKEALDLCRKVGNHNFEIETLGLLGLIALDWGEPQQARRYFQQAVEVAQANQQTMDWAEQVSHLALAQARLGQMQEARRLSDQAAAIMAKSGEQLCRISEVYFERYQIVAAAEGQRAARPHLERAHRYLLQMAADIADPDLRRSFLEQVALNRAILTAYRLDHPPAPLCRQTVRLPHAGAPTGRPLHDDEYVAVTWTLSEPLDKEIKGKIARRRQRILRLLHEAAEQSAVPTVAALADALGVSARTIKRDLAALRAAGYAVSTRGSH